MKMWMAVIGLMYLGLVGRVEAIVVYSGIQDFLIPHGSEEDIVLSFPGIDEGFLLSDRREGIGISDGGSVYWTVRDPGSRSTITNFEFGNTIDSSLDWKGTAVTNSLVHYWDEAEDTGNFYDRTNSYVPMRTELESSEYFGWLRVSHSAEDELFTLHDWAWNTTPGDPILAGQIPEPATYAKVFGVAVLVIVVWLRGFRGRKEAIR